MNNLTPNLKPSLVFKSGYSRRFVGGIIRLTIAISACVLMVSCQTTAQIQADSIRKNAVAAVQDGMMCLNKIAANPAYQGIAKHTPINGGPSIEQLADEGFPNDEDIKAFIACYNETLPCRNQMIQELMKFLPGCALIFIQASYSDGLIAVDLIQRKITWGEANKRWVALTNECTIKLQGFVEQLNRELAASHQAELAQRQEALNALLLLVQLHINYYNQQSQQQPNQQLLIQQQQIINEQNRVRAEQAQREYLRNQWNSPYMRK